MELYSFSCFDHYNVGFHNDSLVNQSGPILESKGKGTIFQKKGKEMLSEGKNVRKFGHKCTKFENILKKGR